MPRTQGTCGVRAIVCAVLACAAGRTDADLLLPLGTRISNGGDDGGVTVAFTPSFTFAFYGAAHTGVRATDNGVIGWTPGNTDYGASLATTYGQQAIAPFWQDLNSGNGGIYGYQTGSVYAVTYPNAFIYGDNNNANSNQFQVALFGAAVQVTRTNTGHVFDFKAGDIAFSYGFMSFTQKTITVGLKDGGRSQAYTGIPGAADGRVTAANKSLLPTDPETFILFRPDATGSNYTSWVTNFAPPAVTVPTIDSLPASGVTAGSATMNGDLSSDGLQPTTVMLYWGTHDGGTNASGWGQTNELGIVAVGSLATNVTGLAPNTSYFYRFRAVNASGDDWGSASMAFTTLGAPVIQVRPVSSIGTTSAVMNATLVSTGVAATAVTLYWGPADGGTNAGDWANTNELGVLGAGSVAVSTGPLLPETLYFYRFRAANGVGDTWTTASVSFVTATPLTYYRYGGAPVAIPDPGGVTTTVQVAESFKIGPKGLAVAFSNLHHPYAGDLRFTLIGPDATAVVFVNRPTTTGKPCLIAGNEYTFADNGVVPPTISWPSGTYKTANSLNAAFVGRQAQGTWTLIAEDLDATDAGGFDGWSLGLDKPATGSLLTVR